MARRFVTLRVDALHRRSSRHAVFLGPARRESRDPYLFVSDPSMTVISSLATRSRAHLRTARRTPPAKGNRQSVVSRLPIRLAAPLLSRSATPVRRGPHVTVPQRRGSALGGPQDIGAPR